MMPMMPMMDDEKQIRQLDADVCRAVLEGDVAALDRLWSDDYVVSNPLHHIFAKPQVLGAIEDGRIHHATYERQIDYLRVDGDTAVVMGGETVVDHGSSIARRYTEVWLKRDDQWRQIARHTHVVPAQT